MTRAAGSGTLSVAFDKIDIKRGILVASTGKNNKDKLTLDANIIQIGDGYSEGVGTRSVLYLGAYTPDPDANPLAPSANSGSIVVGHVDKDSTNGTKIIVESDGRLDFYGTSGATTVNAESIILKKGAGLNATKKYGETVSTPNEKNYIESKLVEYQAGAYSTIDSGTKLTFGLDTSDMLGNINVTSGANIEISGELVVNKNKTMTLDKNALIYSKVIGSGDKLTVNSSGTLVAHSSTIKNFLTGDSSKRVQKGTVNLNSGLLVFADTEQVDLAIFKYASGDTNSDGTILANSNSLVKGNNFLISDKLSEDATKLSIQSKTLTLGSNSKNITNALGFSGARTSSISFLAKDGNFVLQDAVTLSVDYDGDGKADITENEATISGNFTVSGNKTFTIDGGSYTMSDNLTLKSGSLNVGTDEQTLGSSLVLSGNLKFDNTNENNITIQGKAASGQDSALASVLDIRNATLEIDKTKNNLTSINVHKHGSFLLNSSQINDILTAPADTKSGTGIFVSGAGLVSVDGDIGSSAHRIDVAQLKSGSVASSHSIIFSGDASSYGRLKADTLYIVDNQTGSTTGQALDLGSGHIELNSLNISTKAETDSVFDFVSGHIQVLNGINVGSYAKTMAMKTDANLALGYQDAQTQTIVGGGLVDVNLDLQSGGALNVWGNWTAQDVLLGANGSLDVNKGSTLSVNKFSSSATDKTNIDGQLSILGVANTEESKDSGLTLGANSVNLSGKLILGSGVAEDFVITRGENNADSTISSNAGITEKAIKLDGGTLQIDFDANQSFTQKDILALKKHIFAQVDEQGTINGVLHIGNAKLEGVSLGTKDENGRYDFSQISGVSDVKGDGVTNNDFTNNSFTTATGNVSGILGSIHVTGQTTANIKNNAGFVNSATNNGKFVSTIKNGQEVAADINFTGKELRLENGGEAGNISLIENSTLRIDAENAQHVAQLGKITDGSVELLGNTSATEVSIKTLSSSQGASLVANSLTIENDSEKIQGNLNIKEQATFKAKASLAGQNTFGELNASDSLGLYAGNTAVSGDAQISSTEIGEGASLVVGGNLTAKGQISVGEDKYLENGELKSGSTGYLQVNGELKLGGNNLVIDPEYGQKTSIAAISSFDKTVGQTDLATGGQAKGNIILGQNSALMVGKNASLDTMQKLIAPYQDGNGSLGNPDDDGVGAVMALNSKMVLANDKRIIIDPTRTKGEILGDTTQGIAQGEIDKLDSAYIGDLL